MSAPHSHLADDRAAPAAGQTPFAIWSAGIDRSLSRGLARVTGTAVAPYQIAIVRIGLALTQLFFLLREFPHRDELYGPDSPWGLDLARRLIAGNHAFTVLLWNDGRAWFELVYAVAIVSAAALLVGWRTRTASLLFMIAVLSLQNRNVFMGDGGDNVIHIMAIYLAFTRCGQVWSIDHWRAARKAARAEAGEAAAAQSPESAEAPEGVKAPEGVASAKGVAAAEAAEPDATDTGAPARSGAGGGGAAADLDPVGIGLWVVLGAALVAATLADKLSNGWALIFWGCWIGQALWWAVRRYAPGEPRTLLQVIGNIVHNGAMLVIVAEVCLIYSTAGWYKIQGSRWQDGTALYYPLHLDDFTPWPALSHALAGNDVMVMLITYGTVIVQVAFPFTLFNRRVKNVLLACMMVEHASIAIVLGLPFFSLAMIAADAVFLPTGFLRWLGRSVVGLVRGSDRTPAPAGHAADVEAAAAAVAEPSVGATPPNAVA